MSIRTHGSQVKEGIPLVDFLENYGKHSLNNYTFADSFTKEMEVKMRLFAPRSVQSLPCSLRVLGSNEGQKEGKELGATSLTVNFKNNQFYDFLYVVSTKKL